MERKNLLSREVSDFRIEKDSVAQLAEKMWQGGGFSAKGFGTSVEILSEMFADKSCKKFFSFPADICATGLRGAIAQMIEKNLVDVIITTCGTLDHDLARAWGGKYFHGAFEMNDEDLREMGINRLGNVLVPNESYGEPLEKNMRPILEELQKKKTEWGGRELIHEFGSRLNDKNSILFQAAKKNIPIYVPGITDGAFGSQLVWFSQENKFSVDLLADERELADICFRKGKTGALMIGGGISKHHTIWWNQFKGGLDYAVQITTATQYDGSLSGARLSEAVSWGKVSPQAKYVNVDGDATILLPIILAAVYEKLGI
ncbi:MAG TPA: deoxyhypusine synthase [archaeon]|nr:deoxyhypusine synthase [archaeon]